MQRLHYIIIIVFILVGCVDTDNKSRTVTTSALGKMNEIVVIADDDIWEGPVGDTLKYYFESAYPILPAPEPLFDLRHFTPTELTEEPLRKELRTYLILADLSDADSPTTKMLKEDLGQSKFDQALEDDELNSTVGKDKWARGQLLAYLFASSEAKLLELIPKRFTTVANRVIKHDEPALDASVYAVEGVNKGMSKDILEDYNVNIQMPGSYRTVIEDREMPLLWMRRDIEEATFNIVFQRFKYENPEQLEKDRVLASFNEFGKEYVRSTDKDSYLVINDQDLPINRYDLNIEGVYGAEYRGIWEMTEDFIGGPFISYVILDEDKTSYTMITVFVMAPGKKKRDFMRQLDHIVKKNLRTT